MCGIAGYLHSKASDDHSMRETALEMADCLSHRGPDDRGSWSRFADGVALAHRRLSILDLSERGHQPMASRCGRFTIVYNGEIYNHQSLRVLLAEKGRRFSSECDTETLVEAIALWGVQGAAERCVGMFAFAVWDAKEKRLSLVRDRLGLKPLYYGWQNGAFLFGSELKALRAHPSFEGSICRTALALYLAHNYVPAPYSIYEKVYKLPPATILTIEDVAPEGATLTTYWNARQLARSGGEHPFAGDFTEAADELHRLMEDAVRSRMLADVPLGAFLSGGIDSSLVTALMQRQSSRPVQTFSIGFTESQYDEAPFARKVAEHLRTDHVEHYATPRDAQEVIPQLPSLYDEPFSDSSQVPTFLVCQLARQHVKVALSGDGGDELFCGYERYFHIDNIWRRLQRMPGRGALSLALAAASRAPSATWKEKLRRRSRLLSLSDPGAVYRRHNVHWALDDDVVNDAQTPTGTPLVDPQLWPNLPDHQQQWMWLDTVTYLPDDILVKVDRASMGVGLEARAPLIDHRIVEFAWRLPLSWKIRDGQGKWMLRELLARHVPRELFERPKQGFGVPIDQWLRGPLRDWAESLLDERRLRDEGFFRPQPIRQRWRRHLDGKEDWHYHLWDVLMFQAWRESLG